MRWPAVDGKSLRNPWKLYLPTLTATSVMVCRFRKDGATTFKRLHGLEAMRCIGWDLGHFQDGTLSSQVDYGLLCDLAGNAWSSLAFLPVAMAAFGAAPWGSFATEEDHIKKDKPGKDTDEDLVSLSYDLDSD